MMDKINMIVIDNKQVFPVLQAMEPVEILKVSGMLCRKPLAWRLGEMVRLPNEHHNEVTTEGVFGRV